MFLRNYDNYMAAIQLQDDVRAITIFVNNTSVYGDGYANMKSTNGTVNVIRASNCSGTTSYIELPVGLSNYQICFGTGSEAVTYDDYKLSGSVIDNTKLVFVSTNNIFDVDTKRWKKTSVFGYTNSTESDITISEWGLYFWNNSNSKTWKGVFSNSSSNCVLMFREVLAEPVTIAAGTTGTLTFTLEIPTNHP